MSDMSDFLENRFIDALFRTGPTLWAASTAFALNQLVYGDNASAPGKIMICTVAGTSGATQPTWPAAGSTVGDNTVTWRALSAGLPKFPLFVGLLTAAPSDTGGGTEVTGGSYARVALTQTNAGMSSTDTVGGTGVVSGGTTGQTSNNAAVTFTTPSANWGTVTHVGLYDALTGGNLLFWRALTASRVINSGDSPIQFNANQLTATIA